jgi:lipopolysaccharide export system protein LptA
MRIAPLFVVLMCFLGYNANAQKTTRIELLGADIMTAAKSRGGDASRLVGNVRFKHEETLMRCDSAFLMSESNSLEAFGNVVINNNDSVFVYGNRLYYYGNTRIAQMHDSVKMVDSKMTLTTDHLTYNVADNIGTYRDGGRIVDTSNVLTSRFGYYFADENEFFFKQDVVLTNPDYVMYSDTLMYNTATEVAYFFGPTRIISDDNLIYCENGWYNTITDISQYNKNAYFRKNEHTLKGDSLYYDRQSGIGRAFINVLMTDTVQNIMVSGHRGEYLEKEGRTEVTDSALAVLIEKGDSLFLHGDTLKLLLDSANQAERLLAYYGVKFFRHDIQGACDSLVYNFTDSIIDMYYKPVIWQEKIQLTAKHIHLQLADSELREMVLRESGFIIEQEDSTTFNQVKGKQITAYFSEGKLQRVRVEGNAESVYHVKEEDNSVMGVNKGVSNEMMIYFEDNEVVNISFISNPVQTLFPPDDISDEQKILKGFLLLIKRRPQKKADVFIRDESLSAE